MVYRPTFCVKINCVSLTLIKCTQSTFPGVLTHLCALWCVVNSSMMNFSVMHPCNNFGLWTVNKKSEECVNVHSYFLEMSY